VFLIVCIKSRELWRWWDKVSNTVIHLTTSDCIQHFMFVQDSVLVDQEYLKQEKEEQAALQAAA
jgi:hypothetical protein